MLAPLGFMRSQKGKEKETQPLFSGRIGFSTKDQSIQKEEADAV